MSNTASSPVIGFTLGFRITAQGGATWDTVVAHDAPGFNYYDYFDFLHLYPMYLDGSSPDTAGIVYSRLLYEGLPPGGQMEFYTLEIGPITGPIGATISVDSVASFGVAPYDWEVAIDNGGIVKPSFQSVTVEIAECCQGTVGNVSADPANDINLTDLTLMVNNLFVTFGEFPCPKAANLDLDPAGNINLTDMTILINHLFLTFEPLPACP